MEGRVIGFLTLDSATPGFFTAQHAEQLPRSPTRPRSPCATRSFTTR